MLWLPTKQTRKATVKIKRRKRRRRLARLLLFFSILFGLRLSSAPPPQALLVQVEQVTTPYKFDFIDWESQAVANEIGRRLKPIHLPDNSKQRELIQNFLEQEQQIRELKGELDQLYASTTVTSSEKKVLELELAVIKVTQKEKTPYVELILVKQVEAILREEGFAVTGQILPPVSFRFIEPPTALIISPRDKIENQHFVGLLPGLDNGTREQIENRLNQRGDVSSYITNVGGLGSYPTMVVKSSFLPWLVEVVAHEWVHNYFFSFPTNIAWGYQTYPRLTTINETTADIVGKEVSRKVITRFYPTWVDKLPPLNKNGQPAPAPPSEFHLAMRRIRKQVDKLLAEGRIEEAEIYMEAERLKLVEKGYNLRKLNQAYFAFHGSYALSPTSIDPTGGQLMQLRAVSPSLKGFLDGVGWINSYNDYLDWLAEAGVE